MNGIAQEADTISAPVRRLCVLGLWHLGSVVSACLADLGYSVVGVDSETGRVAGLNSGILPVFEPGLEELVRRNVEAGRLAYSADLASSVRDSDCVIFAYDTPVGVKDEVDLAPLLDAAKKIVGALRRETLIVVHSQVPVGTCTRLGQTIAELNAGISPAIACVPENLRLGQAVERFMKPDMLVIGADDPLALRRADGLFSVIACPKLHTNLKTAEMTKHALNAFFATCISFANELGSLCDELGIDGLKVAQAMRLDKRIGPVALILPGSPFGGGTLARDLRVLKHLGEACGSQMLLVDAVLRVNEEQKLLVIRRLGRLFGRIKGLRVGVLGLTYKAGTSTLRRSQSLDMIRRLLDDGATVSAFDPKADVTGAEMPASLRLCRDAYEAAEGADALVIATEWPEFAGLDFGLLRAKLRRPIILDTKNLLDPEEPERCGLRYFGVGRGASPGLEKGETECESA